MDIIIISSHLTICYSVNPYKQALQNLVKQKVFHMVHIILLCFFSKMQPWNRWEWWSFIAFFFSKIANSGISSRNAFFMKYTKWHFSDSKTGTQSQITETNIHVLSDCIITQNYSRADFQTILLRVLGVVCQWSEGGALI